MTTLTCDDLLESLATMASLIREHSSESEQQRRLSPVVADALRDAGFFRMYRPESRGGLGLDPVSACRVGEALALIDSTAAWNVQVCNSSDLYGPWFSDEASQEVFGSSQSVIAGAFNPPRTAIPQDGGFRVSGRTSFNSNCHSATWSIGLAHVYDGDTQRLVDTGEPLTLLTAIPMEDLEIIENWETLGMNGTGSHDVQANDVFVPEAFAVPFAPLDQPASAYETPLARLPVWATVGAHTSVALGVARQALDALQQLGIKVPAYTTNTLRDSSIVQSRLARAEGLLESARSFFYSTFEESWVIAKQRPLAMNEKANCQLAATHAVLCAVEVVDLVHRSAGTAAIRNDQPFQRHLRDIRVISQHAFLSEARLEAVGQVRLGLEPNWGFFYF